MLSIKIFVLGFSFCIGTLGFFNEIYIGRQKKKKKNYFTGKVYFYRPHFYIHKVFDFV